MSRTLHWRAGAVQPKSELPGDLTRAIAHHYRGHDCGARDGDPPRPVRER
ncbi:hypothetical protein NMG29_31620 [Streptomyces cocklensis]|jgi:hypothetical protein|uniref:Uncharacterized protein n=1 Tax=Actinacidiphila cocklensis TaxID=887465 RepID=A0A9W4DLB3_9ACTN|nr:hypothetical protein [Actinacidiphila cocklensis]MDD1062692.1 hypothetical protein [Actinacidiphila cocklensis]CAG6392080.1 hypothetical protein SCOCK_150052 [Actinacidiphila cocklensis]